MKVLQVGIWAMFWAMAALVATSSFWGDVTPNEPKTDVGRIVRQKPRSVSDPGTVGGFPHPVPTEAEMTEAPTPRNTISLTRPTSTITKAQPTTATRDTTTTPSKPTETAATSATQSQPPPSARGEQAQPTTDPSPRSETTARYQPGQWDGVVSVGPPETCKDRLTAMLLSCQAVVQPPFWHAAYIVASRPYVAEYTALVAKHGGRLWQVLVEEDLVPEFGNASLAHLRPRRGWLRQQDVKLAFLARDGPPNTVLFDSDSLCSCGTSWNKFATAAAKQDKLDMCVETWQFEPARSNMVATAKALGVSEPRGALPALIGWTPQVMSRAMFRQIIAKHRPNLLRDLLELRGGPVCQEMNRLPPGSRLKGRCWTEYFVYQLLAQEYGYWEKYHTVVTGNVEDGRKEAINNRCSHVRINQAKTLVRALEGTLAVPPFLMLDDHAEAFAPQKVLDLVNNKTVAKQCSVYVSISPPAKLVIKT